MSGQNYQRRVITGTSPAAASTAVIGNAVGGLNIYDSLLILAEIQGGTGGTLDLYLQVYDGDDWWDYAHFAQFADGAAAIARAWSVSRHAQVTSIATIGKNLTPALAANSILGGEFTDRMRLIGTAGVGTSAGTTQTITIIGTRTR